MKLFDIEKYDEYREDNRREVKNAKDRLPTSIWETYSSFANCYGGVIILGVKENADRSWNVTGITDSSKLLKDFWDTVHNASKVSINLLTEKNVELCQDEKTGNEIIVIHVPPARRDQKPVYINDDLFGGTYRRDYEGDYHCTASEVKAMLRDQAEDTSDMKVLSNMPLDAIIEDSVEGYRNRQSAYKPGHPWIKLPYEEYLRQLGAAALSQEDGKLHPTAAGLLMFGEESSIIREFPEYYLDYREMLDPTIRWTDRLQSSSGEWSGNLFDFYFKVYNKLIQVLKVPFSMEGGNRIDDTPMHKALREALVNCLVNTDFFLPRAVVVKLYPDQIVMENPGGIRTGKRQMLRGGISDPRNKVLMKMFNLINIGERAGSGVPDIFSVWENEGFPAPQIDEEFGPDRTTLTLSLKEKRAQDNGVTEKVTNKVTNGVTNKVTNEVTNWVTNKVTNKVTEKATYGVAGELTVGERNVLGLIVENPSISYVEMAERLSVSRKTISVRIRNLKEKGLIEWMGSKRKGYWLCNGEF